jgi:hypothetical protein
LILFVIRPVSSNVQNALILVTAALLALALLPSRGWRTSGPVTLGWMAASSAGAVWALIGGINGNPGWLQELLFFVVFPALFMLYIAVSGWRELGNLLSAIPVGMAIVSLSALVYLASAKGLIPLALPVQEFFGFGLGMADSADAGRIEFGYGIRSYNLSSLAFGMPFLFAVVAARMSFENRLAALSRLPAFALSLACLLISGRRGIIVASVLTAVLVLALLQIRGGSTRRVLKVAAAAAAAAALAMAVTGFRPMAFLENVTSASDVRVLEQGPAFIASIANSPLLGHGLGAVLPDFVANEAQPWRYEMQYYLLVNAFGLAGILFIAVPAALLIAVAMREALRKDLLGDINLAVLAGAAGALVANATNPYLHTVGHYWMFFILVLLVDLQLRGGRRSAHVGTGREGALTSFEEPSPRRGVRTPRDGTTRAARRQTRPAYLPSPRPTRTPGHG